MIVIKSILLISRACLNRFHKSVKGQFIFAHGEAEDPITAFLDTYIFDTFPKPV